MGCSWDFHGIFMGFVWCFYGIYPLVFYLEMMREMTVIQAIQAIQVAETSEKRRLLTLRMTIESSIESS